MTPSPQTIPPALVPQAVIDHLKLREGWRTDVYLDSLGKPTAGMGHLLSAVEKNRYPVGSQVPLPILEGWAQSDSLKAYQAAQSQAAMLGVASQDFINALTSVNFQLGTAWNKTFPTTWKLMLAHDWAKAADAVKQSKWFKQTPVRVTDFQAAMMALVNPPAGNTESSPQD